MELAPRTIARLTGFAYLGMLPGGIGAFMLIRPRLLGGTATATLANLVERADLARLGVAGMMTVIVAQALAALGFFALFRATQPAVAFGIAGFGLINSAAILSGAAASWTAIGLAGSGQAGDVATANLVHALYLFEGNAWKLGGLFFGLWLIPMGVGAATSGFFHSGRVLGGFLVVGGVAYVVGSFLAVFPAFAASGFPDAMGFLATIGEVWTMFALIFVGVRSKATA
jgi:hypothetical protein